MNLSLKTRYRGLGPRFEATTTYKEKSLKSTVAM